MPLVAGTKLGPYEILSALAAGGMGEVYRARDTRLNRTVAIKILPAHLASSPDLKQRFEREGKAISSLQHPHICTLLDVGSQDDTDFLVMEYLEGETLADRLAKGAMPLEQVLKVGIEIAAALDNAHQQSVLHRDLKPGNIMLTKAGAKLMDFGLAKPAQAHGPATAAEPLTPSTPTMSVAALSSPASPLTQKGQVVGTFQYLAPEILQGTDADARSDIFSFGCVLYEMVTGHRAFEGKSQLSVLTAILEKTPDPITHARPDVPVGLEQVIASCLTKDPEMRWRTAHDVGLQLRWLAQPGSHQATSPARLIAGRWMWVVAALLAVACLAAGYYFRPQDPSPIIRTSMRLPDGVRVEMENSSLALSPDGRRLVFTGIDRSGKQLLWLRALDSLTAQPLPGTEGATYPFWSPDSHSVGFFAGHLLRRMDASSGIVQTVCDAADGRGASWGTSDIIVFSAGPYSPLYSVPAAKCTSIHVLATGSRGSRASLNVAPTCGQ